VLAGQVLYHINHAPSPFLLFIFQIGSQIFAKASLKPRSPYLGLLSNWDYRLTTSSFFAEMGSQQLFAWAGLKSQSSSSLALKKLSLQT
jgi:hypothetical protein